MSLSALIKRMAEAGAPIEAIIMACEAVEAEQARIAGDREKAAQRKRNQRARERDDSVTVTGQSRDADGTVAQSPPLSRPPNENISNPPTHTPPDITSRARADDFPRLECASPAVWRDFLKNRAKKNLTNTASAHRKLVRDLAAMVARTGWPPGKVFEACVEQGWGAIYETNEMKGGNDGRLSGQNNLASIRGNRPNPALDMLLEAERDIQAEAQRENQGHDWPLRAALPSH